MVIAALIGGISTRQDYALVETVGGASSISKSEVSCICRGLDEHVKAILAWSLHHARFPYVYLEATYLHSRLGRNMEVCSFAGVVAIGVDSLYYREVRGIP